MPEQTITVGLTGNPNCGKTTMFNALTGSHQHVGNWPGVTVEKKIGPAKIGNVNVEVVDLPGTYSLTAYSDEERVARNYLIEGHPSAVVDVLDANSLERHMYLAVQIMELGVPLVLALNMMDEVRKGGKDINTELLTKLTGCPAVETVARSGQGKERVLKAAYELSRRSADVHPLRISYGPDIDPVLKEMEAVIEKSKMFAEKVPTRWVGIKYLEADPLVIEEGRRIDRAASDKLEKLAGTVADHLQKTLNTNPAAIIADYRYGYISSITRQVVRYPAVDSERLRLSDRIDKVLTNRLAGPLVMLLIIYILYKLTFSVGNVPLQWIQDGFSWLGDTFKNVLPAGPLQSLLCDGVIAGVGSVLSFVPLILIMFFLLSALEDSGYMARMAYMLDRVFRFFGLHGTSVLPFIVCGGIAGGCAVPGIMATRVLRSPKEKLATLLTAPFMTCGAKVPVYLMLAAAFFPNEGARVMFIITLCSWAVALLVARLLRSTIIKGESTPFVMELPPYRLPTLRGLCTHTWERSWAYIRKAGTIILAIAIVLWAAMTYPSLSPEQAHPYDIKIAALQAQVDKEKAAAPQNAAPAASDDADKDKTPKTEAEKALAAVRNQKSEAALRNSVAGRAGQALEGVSRLAGFDWRVNISLLGGFAAKEVIVSTLATAYSLGNIDAEESTPLSEKIAKDKTFTLASGIALIAVTLLYSPCFVTVVAMAREAGWKWAAFSVSFNVLLAYIVAVIIFQTMRLFA